MKAGVYRSGEGIKIEERKVPDPEPDEALVGVKACGICMTDVHISKGQFGVSDPLVLGHEFSGVIKEIGDNVSKYDIGDRISVNPIVSCGNCEFCMDGRTNLCENGKILGGAGEVIVDGGFQEYTTVPEDNLGALNQKTSFEKGAFSEPLGCAVRGIRRADISPGDRVLIIGAGPMGLLLLQLAQLQGASEITVSELKEERRKVARKLGADRVLDPNQTDVVSEVKENVGKGVDISIEAVGASQTVRDAIDSLKIGGKILVFGVPPEDATIPLNIFDVYFDEIDIVGSYAIDKNSFRRSVSLLNSDKINTGDLVTHRFQLDELENAIELNEQGVGLKKIIKF